MRANPNPRPPLPWPAQTVLGVWAHPDDEAYLSAGLMVRTTSAGGQVTCLYATRGERGTDDPGAWPPERLGPHREGELAAALAIVGVQRHEILGLPDGDCAAADPAGPVEWITRAIVSLRPDLVVTFGPDGITGHPDHRAVSRWTTEAWVLAGIGELVYAATPRSFLERHRALHQRFGLGLDEAAVPDEQVALRLELTRSELRAKRRCLAAHASQTAPLARAMGERTYRRWVEAEAFRVPTPSELASAEVRASASGPGPAASAALQARLGTP